MPAWTRALLALALALAPAAAAPVSAAAANATTPAAPSVTLPAGVVVTGSADTSIPQAIYGGIPFAAAPTGALRFAPPQPPTYNATLNATVFGPACMQSPSYLTGVAEYGMSEDCLSLNVFAPTGGEALPVMVWIYGGGFIEGAASTYDGSLIVARSIEMGSPVVYVALNYRVGIFGWAEGAEAAANNATNLGLYDQRLALEWVQTNIAAFGGDPTKVTVFGESAGAISISLLMLNESIDLFRGAIMESGAQSNIPLGPANSTWQAPYDLTVALSGCNATAAAGGYSAAANQSAWECLKALPAEVLNNATIAVKATAEYAPGFIFGPSIDGGIIPADPWELVTAGAFAKLPYITGNNLDEGTTFVSNLTNSTDFIAAYLLEQDPSPYFNTSVIETLLTAYPDVPALGSPFGTGNETFGLSPYYKEVAALVGDGLFQSRRRKFLRSTNAGGFNATWTYLFEGGTPGQAAYLGVTHGNEVTYVFGAATTAYNYTAAEEALSTTMQTYWINFAVHLDPNGNATTAASSNATYWPAHAFPGNKNMLQLAEGNVSVIQDDYREAQMAVFGPLHAALGY